MEIENPESKSFTEVLLNVTNTTEENFINTLKPITGLSWHKLHRIKKGFLPTVEQFVILLQGLSINENQLDQLSSAWEQEFQDKVTFTDVANEFGLTPGAISRHAIKVQDLKEFSQAELLEKIRAHYAKIENSDEEELADIKVPKPREKKKELVVDVVEKIDLGYPDVITGPYYDSLTSAEKKAVIHLKYSSFSNPVDLDPVDVIAIEYMIKEGTFPPGARIRRKTLGTSYFLEYNSLAKPNSV